MAVAVSAEEYMRMLQQLRVARTDKITALTTLHNANALVTITKTALAPIVEQLKKLEQLYAESKETVASFEALPYLYQTSNTSTVRWVLQEHIEALDAEIDDEITIQTMNIVTKCILNRELIKREAAVTSATDTYNIANVAYISAMTELTDYILVHPTLFSVAAK
jgi:hypothetical protein